MAEMWGWAEVSVAAVATVAVLLVALLVRTKASHRPRHRLPPGPRGWPILGSLPLMGTLPHHSLYELSKQYGPLMFMHLGSVGHLVVTSSPLAQEILKTNDQTMACRPVQVVSTELSWNRVDIGAASYGPHWRYLRKVCTSGLLTAERISQFQEIREREVLATLHFILEESQRGNAVNMTLLFQAISMNNITQMMMKKRYSVRQSSGSKPALPPTSMSMSLSQNFQEMFQLLGEFNIADYIPLLKPFDPQGRLKQAKGVRRRLDKFLDEIIEEHRKKPSIAATENYQEDFVDALLGIGQTKDFDKGLSMDMIKAILMDMLAAGGDTSAVTALWALTEIMRQPRVMRKVQEELDSVVGQHRLVQEKDLPEFKYLQAVVKETLRLHPPAPLLIPHESSQDCEIQGFHIPARTRVFVNLWGVHRDPAVWERPLEFDPDRFLEAKIDLKGQDFELIPFGSGRRMCPGMNLGLLMVLYPLSLLLHALDFTLPEGQKPEELDMSETFGLVVFKRLPLMVFGKARLPTHAIYPAQQVER